MNEPLITLRRLRHTYIEGAGTVAALNDITLTVQRGEGVAVTGPSGCGKSTLLHVLGLLDHGTDGEHRFAGHDVTTMTPRETARLRGACIGFVFQQFHLLPHLSALDNVALPLRYRGFDNAPATRRAAEALAAVGLADRMTHKPGQLSGGQCQRTAIARAIVGRPPLLLADEPTGALDSEAGTHVIDLLLALHREHAMTLLIVTHDLQVARRLPRRVTLRDGRVRSDVPQHAGAAHECP